MAEQTPFERAVDAAGAAIYSRENFGSQSWDKVDFSTQKMYRRAADEGLSAAIPHLLADVRALAEKFAAEAPHDKQISDMQPSDFIAVGRAVVGERIRDELDRLTEEASR